MIGLGNIIGVIINIKTKTDLTPAVYAEMGCHIYTHTFTHTHTHLHIYTHTHLHTHTHTENTSGRLVHITNSVYS